MRKALAYIPNFTIYQLWGGPPSGLCTSRAPSPGEVRLAYKSLQKE